MARIQNPVLRGFNPDPCICRAGDAFYIATSTFEWYPGVQIYRSADMANWTLAARPLVEGRHMDLRGCPDSAGIWAPSLTFCGGVFYLVYTVAHQIDGIFKDVQNYLATASSVEGEWSKPVALNASGFDPSLFHDGDGRKYLVNPLWDYRSGPGRFRFAGLLLQEYSAAEKRLAGEAKVVFGGSAQGITEGPSLMKKDGWYYIVAAEGGTGRHHSIMVARSRNLWGPYGISPYHPLITSYHDPENPLQKAGHGNMVEWNGNWYLVHLCSRYLKSKKVCPLGRETAIQNIEWENGWPRLAGGRTSPEGSYEAPAPAPGGAGEYHTDFRENALDAGWMSLRRAPSFAALEPARGVCRLSGGESLTSLFDQSLLARKVKAFDYAVSAALRYRPRSCRETAGLVLYYNTKAWQYLYVSYDEKAERRILNILTNDNLSFSEPLGSAYLYVPEQAETILLCAEVRQESLQFSYSLDGGERRRLGPVLDASILSDEHVEGWAYTGTVAGINAVDFDSKTSFAEYVSFDYVEL